MNIPFTVEQFFDVFKTYNVAIWPAQVVAYVLGVIALALAIRQNKSSGQVISGILAIFWIWMGLFYHVVYFSPINPVARIFGVFYILQGVLFLLVGTIYGRLSFRFTGKPIPVLGACFIVYAMAAYSLLGMTFGHHYPSAPLFGVAPCPTTIFTFGILLWATTRVPVYLLIIPLLWSIVGMSAAVSLKVPQDYGLVIAGVLGAALIIIQNRARKLANVPERR
jgi:hypothetical protein